MKKFILIIIFSIALFAIAFPAAASITIDYNYKLASDGTLTTPYSFAVVDTYDSGRPGWSYSGNYIIDDGSASGVRAEPYNNVLMSGPDVTQYFSVPQQNSGNLYATVQFGGGAVYHYLGLFWGSVDEYNEIQFLNNGNIVSSWTGTQVTSPSSSNGNQNAPFSNLYVNFYDVPAFDAVRFSSMSGYGGSSPFAFEFDNLAVSVVPLPATILLGLLGLGIGGWRLRKSL